MIVGSSVMDAWKLALRAIRTDGRRFTDDEGRACFETLNLVVRVDSLGDCREPLRWLRSNGGWLYPSDDELQTNLFSRAESTGRYAFGPRIFSFRGKLDQLEGHVIPLLRDHPESRRALILLADPMQDELSVNYISMLSLWFRITDGKLHVTATIRSNDFLIGWPANIFQCSLLLEKVAERLGVQPGSVTTISLSAHFFGDDERLMEKLLGKR